MNKTLIGIIIGSITTFILTISIFFLMNKGEAEIVVGDANGMNPGVIEAYSGSTAPTGYLLCNGQAVSRTTYADLFKMIGTSYGAGDGSTTFNVPNLNGKVAVGKDTSTFTTLGSTGGSSTTTLSTSNMPSHTHSIPALSGSAASAGAHTHTLTAKGTVSSTFTGSSVTSSSNGNHNHRVVWGNAGSPVITSGGSGNMQSLDITSWQWFNHDGGPTYLWAKDAGAHTHTVIAKGTVSSAFTGSSATSSSSGAHTHTVTTTASTAGSTGSGSSFTNLQPYIVVNYIIKY